MNIKSVAKVIKNEGLFQAIRVLDEGWFSRPLRRGIKWLAFGTSPFHTAISHFMMRMGGGIHHSGGPVCIGMIGPLSASIFQIKKVVVLFLIFYLFIVLIEGFLQSCLVNYPFADNSSIRLAR